MVSRSTHHVGSVPSKQSPVRTTRPIYLSIDSKIQPFACARQVIYIMSATNSGVAIRHG
jgi:hypothetical protein